MGAARAQALQIQFPASVTTLDPGRAVSWDTRATLEWHPEDPAACRLHVHSPTPGTPAVSWIFARRLLHDALTHPHQLHGDGDVKVIAFARSLLMRFTADQQGGAHLVMAVGPVIYLLDRSRAQVEIDSAGEDLVITGQIEAALDAVFSGGGAS